MPFFSPANAAPSDLTAYAIDPVLFILALAFTVLVGAFIMPTIAGGLRVIRYVLVAMGRALWKYAVEKAIDAIIWFVVALIGGLLFW